MMKVVIVDDHAVVRAGIRAVLESTSDIEVVDEFASPEAVLPWLRAWPVDLVLMDLRFKRSLDARSPVEPMDGIAAVRAIRASDGPPVVILTTYGSEPEILGALAAGAVGYVLKDASTDELLTAVYAGVHGRRFLGSGVKDQVEGEQAGQPKLTSRELEVLRALASGATNAQIASVLFISEATVKTHLNRIYDKVGASSRTAAVVAARALGLLEE